MGYLLKRLEEAKSTLFLEFKLWRSLKASEFILPLLNRTFMEEHHQCFQQLLPDKKSDKLFVRSLKTSDQRSVFDRMVQSKFQDVRKLLQHKKPLSKDDISQVQRFLRIKLPELIKQNKADLLVFLKESPTDTPHPSLVLNLLLDLFQSESFKQTLARDSESKINSQRQHFLQEKAHLLLSEKDWFLPLTLASIEFFHERAHLFQDSDKDLLKSSLTLLNEWLAYIPDPVLEHERFLNALSSVVTGRAKAVYELSRQPLIPLSQQVKVLYQNYQNTNQFLQAQAKDNYLAKAKNDQERHQIQISNYTYDVSQLDGYTELKKQETTYTKVNQLYNTHLNELTESFHKRLHTLNQLLEASEQDMKSNKTRIQEKIKNVQNYIRVSEHREHKKKPLFLKFKKIVPAILEGAKEELIAAFPPENASEKQLYQQAFYRANQTIQGLNQSKSSVKYNLKQIFEPEPNTDEFAACLHRFLEDFYALETHIQDSQAFEFLNQTLAIFPYVLNSTQFYAIDPIENAEDRIGCILGYLSAIEYKKVLKDLKYVQVSFDFDTLYNLSLAYFILEAAKRQPQAPFQKLYNGAILKAWDTLLSYCLPIGKGKHNLLWNPLAILPYDYTHPQMDSLLSEKWIVTDKSIAQEDNLDFDDQEYSSPPSQKPTQHKMSIKQFDVVSEYNEYEDDADVYDAEEINELDENVRTTSRDIYRKHKPKKNVHQSTSSETGHKIPSYHKSEKFQMYNAPTRRTVQAYPSPDAINLDDDELFNLMGQTQMKPSPSLSLNDLGDYDDAPLERTRITHKKPDPTFKKPPSDTATKKKRWLEVTPSAEESGYYENLADDVLSNNKKRTSSPQNTEIKNYNSLVNDILKNNQMNQDDALDTSQTFTGFNPKDRK